MNIIQKLSRLKVWNLDSIKHSTDSPVVVLGFTCSKYFMEKRHFEN